MYIQQLSLRNVRQFADRTFTFQPGFNLLIGIAQSKGLFSEIKIGAIDSPSFKFGIGYTFR